MVEYFDLWKLLAGLGIFLVGMSQLENALKKLASRGFIRFLHRSTDSPISSIFGGIFATTLVQSSSLVGLIVLAFVGAEIIPLVNAIGIVIGSNLGTTFTGWVVATLGFKLNVTAAIYPLLGVGGIGYALTKERVNSVFQLFLGGALLLMGLDFMKGSVADFANYFDLQVFNNYPLFVFLLVGVVFTAIIQSSSAAMMLTLSALYGGVITLPSAAAIIIGADLGTTSTVVLGSLQGKVVKRRVAAAHVVFNLTVDVCAFIALTPLLKLIALLNISDPLYALVMFHSSFNLFGILLFMPFMKSFANFLEGVIVRDKHDTCKYICNVPEKVPDAAIEALTRETRRLLFMVARLNLRFMHIDSRSYKLPSRKFDYPTNLSSLSKMENYAIIKQLEGEIVHYAFKIGAQVKDEVDTKKIDYLLEAARASVYSAKSLKDINQDLDYFNSLSSDILSRISDGFKEITRTFYSNIYSLMTEDSDPQIFFGEVAVLKDKINELHREIDVQIYEEIGSSGLSRLNVSTLLNINNELNNSEKLYLKAMTKAWSDIVA